jgi:hypothetical protein
VPAAPLRLSADGIDLSQPFRGIPGFSGTAPPASRETYTPTNVTPTRTYDADATTTAELADVVGTLIADLQALGLLA